MYTHLYEIVRARATVQPESVALGSQEGLGWATITSRQLLDGTERLAAELASAGVGVGDRVIVWAPSHRWTPVYLFALWRLGAIVVPFDKEMNPEAAAGIIESVTPRLILSGYGEHPAWARDGALTAWWEPGKRGGDEGERGREGAAEDSGTAIASPPPREELAAIFFTSGTTGKPKGCMITHANLCFEVEALQDVMPLDARCRLASILPLSHLFEITCGLLYPLASGAAIHYIPSRRGPDIIRVLNEQHITHMIAVPQLLTMMGKALDDQLRKQLPGPVYRGLMALAERLPIPARRVLFSSVHRRLGGHFRQFAAGGAALPAEIHRLWERVGVRVAQGYGASECAPVIASARADGRAPIGTCGPALRGVEIRLSAEGEILVRGPNIMRGYWQDPARTAEVLQDGWYATGDLGSLDAAGNLTIAGRAKDLLVLPSGMKVWPTDVEDVLREHPAVKDAAVLMVPAAGGGATLHAYLIPEPGGHEADVNGLVAQANGRLAQHQRLATASWWEDADFPRTSTLKLRRALLPLPAATAIKVESVLAADDPVGQAIAGVAKVRGVQPAQTLAELGLDSLGLVDLALALEEKTGKAVNDGDLRLEMTVETVRAVLVSAPALAEGGARRGGVERASLEQPLWPYTWGRIFRFLDLPARLAYWYGVTRTVVLGGEQLVNLPSRVIVAGTHHGFADLPLVRQGLRRTPARRLAGRLVVAAQALGFSTVGLWAMFSRLAFGIYPLRQLSDRDASLRGLVKLANAGNAVLIFPQGDHCEPAREIAGDPAVRFRPGVALLAEALDAAVIPFGLAGTEKIMPPDVRTFQGRTIAGVPVSITRGPLAIAFGPPLRRQPDEAPAAFAARLQAVCFDLTRQAERAIEG